MKKLNLFCFPYAGGSAAVFNPWRRYLHRQIELVAVELAGRGKRIYDPHYGQLSDAVEDVFGIVKDKLDEAPYALFGHSMGGVIAYELAQKIRTLPCSQPVHMFFSGRGAPHIPAGDDDPYWQLPDHEFKEKILELGGTPGEFFQHPELLEVFLPLLKNDFRIAELYRGTEAVNPLETDITVFIGKEEEVTEERMVGWKAHSKGLCSIHFFNGGHFFVNEQTQKVVKIINNTLLEELHRQSGV